MRLPRAIAVTAFVATMFGTVTPASADITAFLGLAGGPSVRGAKGVAAGAGLVIVAFELEYSDTGDDVPEGAPRIRTVMANGLLQTPVPVAGMQFYATAGGGFYHHELAGLTETNFGINVGGGIKRKLIGPLRIRFDYRYFLFSGSPLGPEGVHRVYVGANLKF